MCSWFLQAEFTTSALFDFSNKLKVVHMELEVVLQVPNIGLMDLMKVNKMSLKLALDM